MASRAALWQTTFSHPVADSRVFSNERATRAAAAAGLYPLILGGIVKAVIAAAVLGTAWRVTRMRD
jgi:hypothetical protein